MTEEKKPDKWGKISTIIFLFAIGAFAVKMFSDSNKAVSIQDRVESKVDSLMQNQAHYDLLIQQSNQRIQTSFDTIYIIEKSKTYRYENYIQSMPDPSNIDPDYERTVQAFDSLYKTGYFFTK